MRNLFKRIWTIIRWPYDWYSYNKTAICFYVICTSLFILIIIPWLIGFVTIIKWKFFS